jgi:hypothetical protein
VAGAPAASPSGSPRLSLVPPKGSLDRTEIADLGLDLDHEQEIRDRMKRNNVDPAAGSIATDFDLGRNLPTGLAQPSRDVRDTADMGRVALELAVSEEGCRNVQDQARPHRFEKPSRRRERNGSEPAVLDGRYETLGDAGADSELALAPANRPA